MLEKQIQEISDLVFGKGYLSLSLIKEHIKNSNTRIITKIHEGQLQGFSILHKLDFEGLKQEIFADLPADVFNANSFGYRKMTAVHPRFKRLGLGIKLFEEGQDWFQNQNVDAVVTVSWINPTTLKFRKFLEQNGFIPIQKLNGYWREDSLKRNYTCAACGNPPCHCNGMLYLKRINN